MLENERIVKARKNNMKLYPLYCMLGSDIVFLYAIKMLFLTQVKGINASDVIFSVSMYAFFMIILQVPATIVIEKIGYKKSIFIGNVANVIYITLIMFSTNIWWLIIAEFVSAITFSLKQVAEPSLLNISIPKTQKNGNIYSKLAGRGKARYNYFVGVSNIISGIVYVINPYISIILSMIVAILSCLVSLRFEEIEEDKNKQESKNVIKDYLNDLNISFKFIFRSKRLRGLLIYSAIIWGVFCVAGEYNDSLLIDIGTSSIIIGIVGAIHGIASAIASKKQKEFHNRFRNKSLTYIAISFAVAIILSGIIVVLKAPFILELIIVTLSFIIVKADNSMSSILIERYLANFSNKKILPKIYSANSIVKNISRMVIGILGSILMKYTGTAKAMIIVGVFSLLVILVLLRYMSTRVGLKPEKYKREDIEFNVLN